MRDSAITIESPHTLNGTFGSNSTRTSFKPDADSVKTARAPNLSPREFRSSSLNSILARLAFDGGYKIESVTDYDDQPGSIKHQVVKTMMRLDLVRNRSPPDQSTSHQDPVLVQYRQRFEGDSGAVAATSTSKTTKTTSTRWRSGFRACRFLHRLHRMATQAVPRDAANSLWNSATTRVRITVPADMVVCLRPASCRTPTRFLKQEWRDSGWTRRSTAEKAGLHHHTRRKPRPTNPAKQNQAARPGCFMPITSATSLSPPAASSSGMRWAWTSTAQRVLAMSYYPNEAEPLWSSTRPKRSRTPWKSTGGTRLRIPTRLRSASTVRCTAWSIR